MKTDSVSHTPMPWIYDEVPTSCGRCFRIGSREIIDGHEASKSLGARALPAYACIYDDYGSGETVNKANAAFIVRAVNNHDALVAALEVVEAGWRNSMRKMATAGELAALDALQALRKSK